MDSNKQEPSKTKFSFFGYANRLKNTGKRPWRRAIGSKNWKKTANSNDLAQEQINLDKKLVLSLAKSRIPTLKQLKYVRKFLNPAEIWLMRASLLIIFVCLVFLGARFYLRHLRVVPLAGGDYTEALIGSPKYINPLYASVSDVDNDLTLLVYSSLFKRGETGELVKDLVQSYDLSPDNKVYTFAIRTDAKWLDGSPLTVDDIIFTLTSIKDKQYKSPLFLSFDGVDIDKIDEHSFKMTLPKPYAPFLDLLTFGILPGNLWSQIPPDSASLAELNIKPVGSGQYQFDNLVKDKSGNIKEYDLKANKNYYGAAPYINLKFKFFPDWQTAIDALNSGAVNAVSYLPPELKESILTPKNYNFYKLYLPQLTALFINSGNNAALADKAVRQALAYALDRQAIVNNILNGNAYVVNGPILPNSFAYNPNIKKYDYNLDTADKLLDSVDWKWSEIKEADVAKAQSDLNGKDQALKEPAAAIIAMGVGRWRRKNGNYLHIKLTTVERSENQSVAQEIKKYWENVGARVDLEIIPANNIQSDVIKTRNFEVLFYGQVVGADPDLYPFWHSSQTKGNGLNIVNFNNKDADRLLEDARTSSDMKVRQEKYQQFQTILAEEVPAIFLYSPTYTYVQNKSVKGFAVKNIYLPRDRFADVAGWYIKTGRKIVW